MKIMDFHDFARILGKSGFLPPGPAGLRRAPQLPAAGDGIVDRGLRLQHHVLVFAGVQLRRVPAVEQRPAVRDDALRLVP